jgi:sulfur carrier protein
VNPPRAIHLSVNGESRGIPEGTTVQSLLEDLGLVAGRVACEVNGTIVKRADFGRTVLKEGDAVEVVQMIGGG